MEKITTVILTACLSLCSWYTLSDEPGRLAIIIDDVGYAHSNFDLLTLPPSVTLAILPETPYGKKIAERAQLQHRPLMLHVPMQADGQEPLAGMLNMTMSEAEFNQQLDTILDKYPWVTGINNHMGSALTQASKPMHWLMKNLSHRHLFFIDSRTTSKTVAEQVAKSYPIQYQRRHVFLDHEETPEFIEQQLKQAMKLTHKQQGVIAIGHPKSLTITMLKERLPELLEIYNVELVKTSELLLTGSKSLVPLTFPLPVHWTDHKPTHTEQSPSKPEASVLDQINNIDFLY